MTAALVYESVTKYYDDKLAVDGLTLDVEPGNVFCFLGPNGAGKTTAIHMLMGLKHPSSGDIKINGVSVASRHIGAERKRIGYLAEDPKLYDFLTGAEFVDLIAKLYGRDSRSSRGAEYLQRFGLGKDADRVIRGYSLGMKKKTALAAALSFDPDILVLDEPTGGLDVYGAREVKAVIREAVDADKTVFFTTHILELAERLADRIAIIAEGRLVASGSLEQLREAHGSPDATLEDIFVGVAGPGIEA
ncbi:MAG: ABC transporter ATP-binding protein [Gemmatimonadetes bacterium]|nr:ABC transporter ATP-binding protein [Gemmatimonadota bacterium]